MAAEVAVYEFTADSPNSTDADAGTTAGAWTQTVGAISGGSVRADGVTVEGTVASSITNAEYGSFTFNANGTPLDLSRLSLDYNAENPFAFTLNVFASTDGGVTGFAEADRLFRIALPDVAGTSPVTTVNSSSFLDLGSIPALQSLTGPVEIRFYLTDNSSSALRVHLIDNVRLSALASTGNDPRWNLNANGTWQTAGNWQPAAVPVSGSSVVFGDVATSDRTVTLASNATANRIAFSGEAAAYTISPSATQAITLTGDGELRSSGTQAHTIAARLSGTVGLTKEGGGEVTLTNATNNYTGGTNIRQGTLRATSVGALQGAVDVAAGATLSFEGNAAGGGYNGTFANALTGVGTATLRSNLTTETVTMNAAKSFGGVYQVEGGTLAVSNAGAFGTGGTNTSRTEVAGAVNTGRLALSNNIAVANELLVLNGRTTDAAHVTSSGANSWGGDIDGRGGPDQYNIESTSGTLTLSGRLSAPDAANAPQRFYVFSGAGNTTVTGRITDDGIDDNGIRTASLATNLNVIKRGAGTLTISTESSDIADYHRGATVIEQGTLRVTGGAGDVGELSSRSVTVEAGAVLDLTDFTTYNMQAQTSLGTVQSYGGGGTINANTFGYFDDGSLSPGDSAGTLTINGALNMSAFGPIPLGAINYELSNVTTVGSGVNDLIDVNGSLTANSLGGNFAVNVTPIAGGLATGTYRLIEYNGSLAGNATGANFNVNLVDASGAPVVGATRQSFAVSTATPGQVNLAVTGAAQNLTWSGTNSGVWDVATTANWNGGADQFFHLDGVTFGPTASTFNVSLAANVMPSSVTFDGGANTYTLTGAAIVGGAPINVNSGTVVINNVGNSTTGTITVAAGATLRAGVGSTDAARLPLGDTPYVVNGSLIVNEASGIETITGSVSGSGSLSVESGQLALAGDNAAFTGSVTAGPGTTVSISNIDEGTPLGSTATGTTVGLNGTLYAFGQTGTVAEPVTLNGGALRAGGGTSSNVNWAGTVTVGTGGPAEIRQDGGSDTLTSRGMTISGNVVGSAGQDLSLRVDAGSTTVITGNVQHNGGLSKASAGRAELHGTNSFTGNTTVEAGTLALVGASNLASSPRIEVQAGATLDASARTGGDLALGAGRSLDVNGTVAGGTTAAAGSTISIGGDGVATVGPRTVRFTPPNGSSSNISDTRLRSNEGNTVQGDVGNLSIGAINATSHFRAILGFDLSSTGITDPSFIDSVALTMTAAAPNGAQVNAPTAPTVELLTLKPFNSDTATFNNTPFARTMTPVDNDPLGQIQLISTTVGPNFANVADGDTFGWSQAGTGSFVDAIKNALGGTLYLGTRIQTLATTRSFYTTYSGEAADLADAPGLEITYTDPVNPAVTGVGSAVFEGNLTTAAGSTLEIDLFDTAQHDSLDVNGAATLNGLLSVHLLDFNQLSVNDTFTVLTANSLVNNLTLGGPNGNLFDLTASTPTSLVLTYLGVVALPGDFNGDRLVDAADYTVWRDNQGSSEGTLLNGNGNGGTIDASDYNLWRSNYGASAAAISTAVPEPSSLASALLVGLAVRCVRRRG